MQLARKILALLLASMPSLLGLPHGILAYADFCDVISHCCHLVRHGLTLAVMQRVRKSTYTKLVLYFYGLGGARVELPPRVNSMLIWLQSQVLASRGEKET